MTNYPPNMSLRPLVSWPHAFTSVRRRSPFRSTWSDTIGLLGRELRHLGPGGRWHPESVLQIALREQDFRRDGLPRANSVPEHPGVILNVDSTKGPLSYPCDAFDRWTDNLRAIALGLEALRRIGRYGITPGDEQYRGWQAIEAPRADPTELIAFLAEVAEMPPPSTPEGIALAYRQAKGKAHPDRNGGDQQRWDAVEAAADQLRRMDWL